MEQFSKIFTRLSGPNIQDTRIPACPGHGDASLRSAHMPAILTRIMLLFGLVAMLAACSGPKIRVALESGSSLNPDEDQSALPVVVRVYQLSSNKLFENASFNDIWKQDMKVLGESIISREEVVVSPASRREISFPKDQAARYLAVVAIYRKPDTERWKAIIPVSNGYIGKRFSNSVRVRLSGNTITIN